MNKVYFTCKLSGSRKILPRQLFFRVNIILQFSSVICFNSKARRVKTALKSVRSMIKSFKKVQNIRLNAYQINNLTMNNMKHCLFLNHRQNIICQKFQQFRSQAEGCISVFNSPRLDYIQSIFKLKW